VALFTRAPGIAAEILFDFFRKKDCSEKPGPQGAPKIKNRLKKK